MATPHPDTNAILNLVADLLICARGPVTKRRPAHRADYGDDATVGAYLRRLPWPGVDRADLARDFARYAGPTPHGYCVNVRSPLGASATRYEYFNTLEEMRANWELD